MGGILVNAGSSIINGFLSGIKSAFEGVKNFVGGIASWIAEHKGPLDYDAILLIPAGNAIMHGFGKGLKETFSTNVKPFVKDTARQVADAFSNVDVKQPNVDTWNMRSLQLRTEKENRTQRESLIKKLDTISDKLTALVVKDSSVYMDSSKVSSALTDKTNITARARGIAYV